MQKLTTKTLIIAPPSCCASTASSAQACPRKAALMKNLRTCGSASISRWQPPHSSGAGQDALKAETDNVTDRLKDLKRADIDYATWSNDPMRIEDADGIQIVSGRSAPKSSAFRGLVGGISAVDPDAGELERLHELEAERTVSSQVGYGGAGVRPSATGSIISADRTGSAAARARRRRSRSWCFGRAVRRG